MIAVYAALAVVVLAALYVGLTYNRLVANRNLVAEAWSGIDVQLKRRADLVPNLVETVKGYAAHEDGLLQDLAEWRARTFGQAGPGSQAAVERGLSAALVRLLAVAEAYPELKADANFRELQDQLARIEDELQMARRYYNGAVRRLNTQVQSFPSNLVAGRFGFAPAEFFELDDATSREAPKVGFGRA